MISNQTGLMVTTALAMVAFLAPHAALAQEPSQSAEARAMGSDATSDEIIVTAQKREQRLIEVPQSISVLSAATLENLNAVQFRDFANTVPGLSFTTVGAGFSQVTLRGVTAGFDIGHTVGTYQDDVPIGFTSAATGISQVSYDAGLFDIDRIEILRGPQGTLYGASTMGGLIKYVTKVPSTAEFSTEAQAGISDTRHGGVSYNAAVAINLPLATDRLALRASAFESHDGGFVDNVAAPRADVNRSDVYGGRLDLLFTPSDRFSVRVSGIAQNIRRDGQATVDYTLGGAPIYGRLSQSRTFAEPYDQDFRLLSGTLIYDFGGASLTSVSAYQTQKTAYNVDITGQFLPILTSIGIGGYSGVGYPNATKTQKFTQELRIASNGKTDLEWLVGAFYTKEKSNNVAEITTLDLSGNPIANDLFFISYPFNYTEYAAFADVTYRFSEKFDIQGGVRYARNNQSYQQDGAGLFIGSAPRRTSEDDAFTYLANARYHFSRNSTAYVRYATGYRPGGPNTVANDPTTGLPVAPPTFDPDHLKSYEAGFKAETNDRTFGVDVAAYYIEWNNMHILTCAILCITGNASSQARIKGAELTLTARPSRSFTAQGAFAYQNAKLNGDDIDLGARDGERLPNVPRFSATISTDYRDADSDLKPTLGATLRFVSDRQASFDGSASIPQYQLPDYAQLDLRAGIELNSVSLQFYVRNVFDVLGQLSADTSRGPAQVSVLQPRTIGLSARANF